MDSILIAVLLKLRQNQFHHGSADIRNNFLQTGDFHMHNIKT